MSYAAEISGPGLVFTAEKTIAAREELTINYNAVGGGAAWHDDNWFERMEITPMKNNDGGP